MTLPDIEWEEPPLVRLYYLTADKAGTVMYSWHSSKTKRYRRSVHRAYRKLGVFP